MIATADIILESGDWRARVLPQAGGLLAALDCGGVPILRTMPTGRHSALDAACFVMVPWCNRIAGGRFAWAGKRVVLASNFPPEPHAIHGHGWQSEWAVAEAQTDSCTLVHRHDGAAPGWPWAYEAVQHIALTKDGCAITLSLTNHAEQPMPAGLGLHPYLRRRRDARLRFASSGIVEVGADMIPTGERLPPTHFGNFDTGAGLPDTLVDHCFAGWDGVAHLCDDLGTITLRATGAGALHLYAPQDQSILCLEPVSHLPDAVNGAGVQLCAPGEAINLKLRISAG